MRDFKTLDVWRKAHELALAVYRITKTFPKEELYGLTSQIRRAGSSIPTNIGEGCGRKSAADFSRFLQNAFGSACKPEDLFLLASDLGMIKKPDFEKLTNDTIDVKKMLAGLIRKLNADH